MPNVYPAYFAYGANLDREHMAKTAPQARVLGRAVLAGYRLAIGRAGYATVTVEAGHEVHGLLWCLSPEDEEQLDRFEGVPRGLYRKARVTVRTADGEREAMIYLAGDPSPGRAAAGYLGQILRAAARWDFPEWYRSEISRLPVSPTAVWSGEPD